MLLARENKYGIDYDAKNVDGAKTIIIATHGFCGDKESSCITALEEAVAKGDVGLIKFDWPGHGKSAATGDDLLVENCLEDLTAIVDLARAKAPQAKLVVFATSFGGYLALIYNAKYPGVFNKIILRSPAIRMYDVLTEKILTPEALAAVDTAGFTTYGFERDLKITRHLIDDLKAHDVLALYSGKNTDNISIIHGTEDDLVPFADSASFIESYGGKLYPVAGADHRYKKPGEIDQVIEITKELLAF